MITGRAPFEGGSSVELLVEHLKTEPPKPSQVVEIEVPAELEGLIMRCLEKRPEDRFSSVADLESALAALELDEVWDFHRAHEWWTIHGIGSERSAR